MHLLPALEVMASSLRSLICKRESFASFTGGTVISAAGGVGLWEKSFQDLTRLKIKIPLVDQPHNFSGGRTREDQEGRMLGKILLIEAFASQRAAPLFLRGHYLHPQNSGPDKQVQIRTVEIQKCSSLCSGANYTCPKKGWVSAV